MLDYKAKYKELKAKMIESTDLTYRLGMADGMKLAQQQAQQAQKTQDKPREPRRIEIMDEDGEPSVSRSSSAAQPHVKPEVVKPQEPSKPESSGNPVEDMRRQVAELQEELRRLRS